MKTIVRFFESETEPAFFVMGNYPQLLSKVKCPYIENLPPFLPKKYEKVCLPSFEKTFIVTDITFQYDEVLTFVDIILVPEENYN